VAADGEEAGVELSLGRDAERVQSRRTAGRDRSDEADLSLAIRVAPALRHLAAVVASAGSIGNSASMSLTISAAEMTSSIRQPFVAPTSMYSMKRRTCVVSRK